MDSIILPGGNQGTIPPEFQGRLQAMPIIPQEIKDAQKAYIEEGQYILRDLNDIIDNSDGDYNFESVVFANALKWMMKGMLPIKI